MQRVGILVHPTRPVRSALEVLGRWIGDHDLELVQVQTGEQPQVAPFGDVGACDLVAALGGDGTVLKALHAAAPTQTPVLGIACGSLGALTTVAEDELSAGLGRYLSGDWTARRLPALTLTAEAERLGYAINDIVFMRRGGTQLVVDVRIDGELYVRIAGDGVVIASALGSSAYSMAAGGPLLIGVDSSIVCTPLAMHGGCAPPLVMPDDARISLHLDPGHGGFTLDVDGIGVESQATTFDVGCERRYTTLVDLGGAASGLGGLRKRGLIIDSPRVAARERRPASDSLG